MIKDGIEYEDIFDGTCYLARYPDVAADGKYNTPDKAFDHWIEVGQYEGRIPGCKIGPVSGNTNPPQTSDPVPGTIPPATSNKTGLIIAAAALLIVFSDKIKKMF